MDIGCSYTILMGVLVEKQNPDKDDVMQWHMQEGNITDDYKVKVDFALPALNATNILIWKWHVDDSANGRYDMILL